MPLPELEPGLTSTWMNAAGFMGYLPQRLPVESFVPGAFVTNPISLLPRSPAHHRTVVAYQGGFLMHSGYPNPGLKNILKSYARKWQTLPIPVWVHLLVSSPYECQEMVREVEGLENVSAIELGLPLGLDTKRKQEMIRAAVGELPIIVAIPLDEIDPVLVDQISTLGEVGVVISAPRGAVPQNGKTVSGRLYGPSLHPQMLWALGRLRGSKLPIVAGCGIFSIEQGESALAAGAAAVQADAWCWQF